MWMFIEAVYLWLQVSPTVKIAMKIPFCMAIAWGKNLWPLADVKWFLCSFSKKPGNAPPPFSSDRGVQYQPQNP